MFRISEAVLWVGRGFATLVAVFVGLVVLADIFVSQWAGGADTGLFSSAIRAGGSLLVGWTTVLLAFALLLGFFNVVSVHWNHISARKPDAIYSIVLLAALGSTLIIGFGPWPALFEDIFDFVLQPLEATLFALLALFIATAAFRAFRVRNLETFFFVLFALIVLLGQVPVGFYLWSELSTIKDWILNVPILAGVRGILLGVALGVIATGLRVLIGADRPYTD